MENQAKPLGTFDSSVLLESLTRLPPKVCPKTFIAFLSALLLGVFVWLAPHNLPDNAAIALLLVGLAIIGWTLTPIPDSVVAIAAALGLVLTGSFPEERFYAAMGSELIWLLISAFIIAAAVQSSGLTERFARAATRPFSSVVGLFHVLTLVISATAFMIPSTSGRAALLVPVFLSLLPGMPTERLRRALALLFPTVILLSAGGSLIGAGAHFVAAEAIRSSGGVPVSFFNWIALGLPIALISTHSAAALILILFVPPKERRLPLDMYDTENVHSSRPKQKRLMILLTGLIIAWSTTALHGLGVAIIACIGAVLVVTPFFTDEKAKTLFRNVEIELLVFLAATVVIAQAVVHTGKSKWFADQILMVAPLELMENRVFAILIATFIAVVAHVFINSRSARAAVLIPSLALPLAEFGHDVTTLVMVTVLGTGFCQTMVASAKPIAVFKSASKECFKQADLFKLALPLLPLKMLIIAVFAIFIWPIQIQSLAVPGSGTPSAISKDTVENIGPLFHQTNRAPDVGEDVRPLKGALCTRDDLETLMLGTIRDHSMWAAGWWHIWDRLRRNGIPVEKAAVRDVYRAEDMVRLRAHSIRLAHLNLPVGAVHQAYALCAGKVQTNMVAFEPVPPVPRMKP